MKRLTLKDARKQLRDYYMTLTKVNGEYRVNFAGGTERTMYYTNDIQDAFDTAKAMAAQRNRAIIEMIELQQLSEPTLKGNQ